MSKTTDEILDCFINPVKNKILAGIDMLGKATGKQLLDMYSDIPPATLYRALDRLTKVGVIEIVEEHRIRGAVEKVYAINKKINMLDAERIVKENDGQGYLNLFLSFTKLLMCEFDLYAKRTDIDILHDGSGFTAGPICVTSDELKELAYKVVKVIEPYAKNSMAPNRKNHTIAIIYTPPQIETSDNKKGDKKNDN